MIQPGKQRTFKESTMSAYLRPLFNLTSAICNYQSAIILLVTAAAAQAAEPAKMIPESQVVALPAPKDPTVCFRLWFQVGSQDDPPGKEGLAAITAAMLTEAATKQHSYEEILDLLSPMAGGYGSSVDAEMMVIGGRIHKDNLNDYVPLLMQAVLEPAFKQQDLDRIKSSTLNYLENVLRYSSDEELAKAVLYNTIFAGTDYGHLSEGTIASVKSISLSDVQKFYRFKFCRERLVIGIGGGYSPELVEQLRTQLAGLPSTLQFEPPFLGVPRPLKGIRVKIVEKECDSTAISLGFPIGVHRGSKDWYALAVANSWLGEHRNSSSQLYQVLREVRGLNYGDYTYIEHFPNAGELQMPPTNVGRRQQIFEMWIRPVPHAAKHFALRTALRESQHVVDHGLTEQEFQATRKFLQKYIQHYAPTTTDRLAYALDDRFYGIDGSHLELYAKMLNELTLADVNAAIKKYWQCENMQIVIVTDKAEALKEALVTNSPSPYTYPTSKSAEVLKEDDEIVKYPLTIKAENVKIVPVTELFEK
jgi:zinc protease